MEIYLKDETYNSLVKALFTLRPCIYAGRITADQIKLALGEIADVWPASILPDVLAQENR